MSILSQLNYCVDSGNAAYPPCVGGSYNGGQIGTQANPFPTTATLLASGPTYTVTPFQQLPQWILFVGGVPPTQGGMVPLDGTKLYKEAHDTSATAADRAKQLIIDVNIPDPVPGTPPPLVNVNVWSETVGGVNKIHVEPR